MIKKSYRFKTWEVWEILNIDIGSGSEWRIVYEVSSKMKEDSWRDCDFTFDGW